MQVLFLLDDNLLVNHLLANHLLADHLLGYEINLFFYD